LNSLQCTENNTFCDQIPMATLSASSTGFESRRTASQGIAEHGGICVTVHYQSSFWTVHLVQSL
jgi:hypothetical protein